jgi:hypothetical protein
MFLQDEDKNYFIISAMPGSVAYAKAQFSHGRSNVLFYICAELFSVLEKQL